MNKLINILTLTLVFIYIANGQEFNRESEDESYSSLTSFLKAGEIELHMRSFWMSTYNRGELIDYSALAAGAGIGYVTPSFKGFKLGMSGYFIFRLHEQNISARDQLTSAPNRYEVALFDMNDPENGKDLDRLEDLYIEYEKGNFSIVAGRQHINTPFINGQDNRMRPNLFSGIWSQWTKNKIFLEGGYIGSVSPRGTVDWYTMEESLGVYPFGRNIDGQPSEYKGAISSRGVIAFGGIYNSERIESKVYNYVADNIFYVGYADFLRRFTFNHDKEFSLGIQGFYQTAIGDGGNSDPRKTFIHKGEQTFGTGQKIGFKKNNNEWSLNTLYIHDSGRFLFPREWGREQFWASMPRERFEGNGNLLSLSTNWTSDFINHRLQTFAGFGLTRTTDPTEALLNKNGMPSWYHIAGRALYHFAEKMEGVSIETLIVYKGYWGDTPPPPELAINRVDMWQYNLIVDYKF